MKQNVYYREFYTRRLVARDFFLGCFALIASYPKLLLEVFLRKNFGDRYFNLASVITAAALFAWIPTIHYRWLIHNQSYGHANIGSFWGNYTTWYIFLGLFLVVSFQRWRETRLSASQFDFDQFTLSDGEPFVQNIPILNLQPNPRTIQTFCEPVVFFLLGLLLLAFEQPLGRLLIFCSLIYSFANMAAYNKGTEILKNLSDDRIASEEMRNTFVHGLPKSQTRGFQVMADLPKSKQKRNSLVNQMTQDIDLNTVAR